MKINNNYRLISGYIHKQILQSADSETIRFHRQYNRD
jgi:hypothetical protein